jgi:hypothetical protein
MISLERLKLTRYQTPTARALITNLRFLSEDFVEIRTDFA